MNNKFNQSFDSLIDSAIPVQGETPESLCLKLFLSEIHNIPTLAAEKRDEAMKCIGEMGHWLSKHPLQYNEFQTQLKDVLGVKAGQLKDLIQRGKKKIKTCSQGYAEPNPLHEKAPDKIFFDGTKYYRMERDGCYHTMQRKDTELHLKMAGFSFEENDGGTYSPGEEQLYKIQRHNCVTYAGPLCGRGTGLVEENNYQLLVTSPPTIIDPAEGDASPLTNFFLDLFGRSVEDPLYAKQFLVFCRWVKQGRNALLRSGTHLPGQMIAFIGPVDCGKTLAQDLISKLLGGREADPSLWLQGKSSFNSNMWRAEHLILSDSNLEDSPKAKKELRDRLKEIIVNLLYTLHRKHQDELSLRPIWRISLSANDDPDSIPILPALDQSMRDKIIYLKVYSPPVPFPTETTEARDAFYKGLVAAIPAFIFMMDKMECPRDLISSRFGVKEFHHPEIVKLLDSQNPDSEISEMLETWMGKWPPEETEKTCSASEIYRSLSGLSPVFSKITSTPKHLGHQLSRLSKRPEWSDRLFYVSRRIGASHSEQYAWRFLKIPPQNTGFSEEVA